MVGFLVLEGNVGGSLCSSIPVRHPSSDLVSRLGIDRGYLLKRRVSGRAVDGVGGDYPARHRSSHVAPAGIKAIN